MISGRWVLTDELCFCCLAVKPWSYYFGLLVPGAHGISGEVLITSRSIDVLYFQHVQNTMIYLSRQPCVLFLANTQTILKPWRWPYLGTYLDTPGYLGSLTTTDYKFISHSPGSCLHSPEKGPYATR